MSLPLVTFFMIVTDPDVLMADYAIRSYRKITGIPFKLRIFSNWVSAEVKRKYFDSWRRNSFVEIESNDWQDGRTRPRDPKLEGPFEKCTTVWDQELKRVATPYVATADADFEILDPKFIPVMLSKLEANQNLAVISTDYGAINAEHYDSYSKEVICLNERWHTWLCVYRREALLKTDVSHFYYEEIMDGPVRRNAWDSSGYLQKALKENLGYEIEVLDRKYQPCFIHYGAFSKNRKIDAGNIRIYRALSILSKRGFLCNQDIVGRVVGRILLHFIFPRLGRGNYWAGWGAQPNPRDETN